MYFDFDDRYRGFEPIGSAINRRYFVAIAVALHAVIIATVLYVPEILPARVQQAELIPQPQPRPRPEPTTFVFMEPRVELPPLREPERPELSDRDRSARSPLKAPSLDSPLPMARGNSRERIEAAPAERMRGEGPSTRPAPAAPEPAPETPTMADERNAQLAMMQRPPMTPPGGSLGDALRNLQKYVQNESFNNQKGQTQDFGPLQFDSKGVEFGPWIRRFVSQVRRNWFVPMAAMTMRGRVVITFYVHRNGALTDVTVIRPSEIESFNTAAVNALLASNPTTPLPPEYPDDKAHFTVTFYYNESPPGR
ncbi:MAG TPA: TonB family protein [Vicinamibacterales bacterium]|nr:TonB family protein [Vicinamibacterales bacterium]